MTNATESGTQRETLTLTDVDATVSIGLACVDSSASENGGFFVCALSIGTATTKTVTVNIAYSGTATAGTDYSGNTTSHTIPVGSIDTTWVLTGKADSIVEGDETIIVDIDSVTNATEVSTQQATVTLEDYISGSFSFSNVKVTCVNDWVWGGLADIDGYGTNNYNVRAGVKLQLNLYDNNSNLLSSHSFTHPSGADIADVFRLDPGETDMFCKPNFTCTGWSVSYTDVCVPASSYSLEVINTYY